MDEVQGSIIINADLDPKAFERGSRQMESAIKSLQTKVSQLAPTFRQAMDGNARAIKQFDAKAVVLESTIQNIQKAMDNLASTRLPTEEYQWLANEISKAEKELERLYANESKLTGRGVDQNSKAWQNLQADIESAKQRIEQYRLEQEQLANSGEAFTTGSQTLQYQALSGTLNQVVDQFGSMSVESANANISLEETAETADNSTSPALQNLGKWVLDSAKKFFNLNRASSSIEKSLGRLTRGLTSFFGRMKSRLWRQAISAVFNGVREGIQNAVQAIPEAESSMNQLKAALATLSNAFGAAFAPILTAVAPALVTLINLLASAVTWVGKLIAALTGASTFKQATAQTEDYAKALGGAGGAAKELKRQLASFDELNILSDNSGGGGGGGGSVSDLFEDVEIDPPIKKWADNIIEAFKTKDFKKIAKKIGDGINTAIAKFDWAGAADLVSEVGVGIFTFISEAINSVDFVQFGRAIATFLTNIRWGELMRSVGKVIESVFLGFADLAAGAFQVIIPKLQQWAQTVDLNKTLKSFGDKVQSVFQEWGSQAAKSWSRTFTNEPEVDLTKDKIQTMISVLEQAIQSGSKWKESLEQNRQKIEACGYSVEDFTKGGVQGLQSAYRTFTEKYAPNMDRAVGNNKSFFDRLREVIQKINEIFQVLVPKTSTFLDNMKQLGLVEDRLERISNTKDKKVTLTIDSDKTSDFDTNTAKYNSITDKTVTTKVQLKIDKSHLTRSEMVAAGIDPFASGGIISAFGAIKHFASGGMIMNSGRSSWWNGVQKYAGGTARARGTLFVAGEGGPEVVGHVNNRTEVLNKSQIASAIYSAVTSAMSHAFSGPMMIELANAGSPAMAGGSVLPYEMARQILSGLSEVENAIDQQTVDLISAITQNRQEIVSALRSMRSSSGVASYDSREIVSDINRQSRMLGRSVLVGG